MKSTKEIIIKGVLCSLLPALCSFIGSTKVLDWASDKKYIGENIDIEALKLLFFLAGILLTFGLLTVNLILSEIHANKYRRQSTELIKYTKEIMSTTLAKLLDKEFCNIDIRIFVPDNVFKWKILRNLRKDEELYFKIKNIEGLADAGITNELKFKVSPACHKEGLVGECYVNRRMVYDDNLSESNSTEYHLSNYQINKTSDLKFIIVCPTFSSDGSIDAIVAYDSKNDIKITSENEDAFGDLILSYTQQLHEKVPELFKP